MIKPFVEANLFELGNQTDSFFATGSSVSIGETPGSFSGPLNNKEQIKISFNVAEKTNMLASSSSMYYFNVKNRRWEIPQGAILEHSGTFQNFSYRTVWYPLSGTYGSRSSMGSKFLEDYKGFDPYGRPVVSGSLNIYRQTSGSDYNQTIDGIGKLTTLNTDKIISFMSDDYPKSCQRSNAYLADLDELFELNVDKPFLIEKIVAEIPLSCGQNWFDDMTTSTIAYATGTYQGTQAMPAFAYYDKGGPGINFSLMCQKKYGTETTRDLIATQLVTHENDFVGTNKARLYFLPYTEGGVKQPVILIDSLGSKIDNSCIVTQQTSSLFLKTNCSITNGSSGLFNTTFIITGSIDPLVDSTPTPPGFPPWREFIFTPSSFLLKLTNLFSQEKISFSSLGGIEFFGREKFQVTSIDAFGRGMTGFAPSGGSIFGKEYVSPQNINLIKNPFYISGSVAATAALNQISNMINDTMTSFGYVPSHHNTTWVTLTANPDYFYSKSESPYLINPGDKLLIAMSKTRPAISSSFHNVPNASSADIGYQNLISYKTVTGSIAGHDVQLNTGSINITFYGSYVKEGNSYVP